MNENKTNINWYPGHMAKTKRLIKEEIDLVDVVILLVDSRIPKSTYIPDIDEFTKGKEKIIVFSKYDLCDVNKTEKWINYYNDLGYKVVTSSKDDNNIKAKIITVIESIMKIVNDKRRAKGLLPKKARVMIVGVSNVGKSTLINKLSGRKSASVGNLPGVTKSLSVIKINDKIELIDTPGVLWPKIESEEVALNLSSMTIIKEEVLPIDKVAIYILEKLSKEYPLKLKKLFGIETFDINNIIDNYINISKYKSVPLINNEADYDKINLLIINSIKNESLKGITFD